MKYALETEVVVKEELEIKSCPFCENDTLTVVHYTGTYGYSHDETYVKCKECGACGPKIEDRNYSLNEKEQKKLAILKWNGKR